MTCNYILQIFSSSELSVYDQQCKFHNKAPQWSFAFSINVEVLRTRDTSVYNPHLSWWPVAKYDTLILFTSRANRNNSKLSVKEIRSCINYCSRLVSKKMLTFSRYLEEGANEVLIYMQISNSTSQLPVIFHILDTDFPSFLSEHI